MTLFPDRTIDAGPASSVGQVVPRNATRAWVLSLLAPGAGQLYCGARTRGIATLVIFFGSVAMMLTDVWWVGIRMAIMLYAFAGLDAYATGVESHHGIEPDAPDNPRVAGVLNLTTSGFGYVYLGWKIGFGTFLALVLFGRSAGSTLPALVEAISFALAAHAYIGGRNARREVYPLVAMPSVLPWVVSGTILGAYGLLVLFAQVVLLVRTY